MGTGARQFDLPRRHHTLPVSESARTGGAVVVYPGVFHNRPHPVTHSVAPTSLPGDRPFGSDAIPYAAWLEGHLGLVDRLARATARRARLSASETDEFLSDVHLKLVADDFAVLRSFKGQSRLTTFLLTVLQRAAFDFRNARWGRWRASAEAERQGETVLRLEELVYRDGLSFDQACHSLRLGDDVRARDRLYEIFLRLPVRSRPERARDANPQTAVDRRTPEAYAASAEMAGRAARFQAVLRRICDSLDQQDRLALRLRFHSGLSLAAIARLLRIDEKRVYRQFEHALAQVRRALESEGFTADAALAVIESCDLDNVLPGTAEDEPGTGAS